MSIIIQNMGGDMDGVCKYQLRINHEVVGEFEHNRRDGLEVCLRKAASTAQRERLRVYMNLLAESYLRKDGDYE